MSRIARSSQPLYQTVNRPVSWPVALSAPDGSAINLTGATATASLVWGSTSKALTVSLSAASMGRILLTGAAALTQELPTGRLAELQLTITDSQGVVTDYVWPVVGETP
ncbi:hypothetical protein [Methylobacterium sp. CM6247]